MNLTEFAEAAGVNVDTLSEFENGTRLTSAVKVRAILAALDRLERERGTHAPPPPTEEVPQVVEFEVSDGFTGRKVVVKYPVGDLSELEQAIQHLLSRGEPAKDDAGENHPNGG